MANNKPTDILRDGPIKATIWKQESQNGAFYRVNLSRAYRDKDGNWKDSDSFSGTELLQVAELARRAYERTNQLRQQDRAAAENGGVS